MSFRLAGEEDETLRKRLGMVAVFCLLSSAAMAQPLAGTGSITGTVRDISGAVVAEAQVEVRNESRGIRREVATIPRGSFAVIALEPASGYTVTVRKPGFAVYEQTELEVLVGEVTNLELTLQIAPEQTRVSVGAAAAWWIRPRRKSPRWFASRRFSICRSTDAASIPTSC